MKGEKKSTDKRQKRKERKIDIGYIDSGRG